MRCRLPLLAIILLMGCSDRPQLVVDVRSDLSPGVEAERVAISVVRAEDLERPGAVRLSGERALGPTDDLLGGVRAFEVELPETGSWVVEGRLSRGGVELGRRRALLQVRGSLAVTLVITDACAGVECGVDPGGTLLTCRAGACVDARCSPETPEPCPADECAAPGDCAPAGVSCLRATCLAGECGYAADDGRCGGGQCDRALGCTGVVDAGVADAGDGTNDDFCTGATPLGDGDTIVGDTCTATDTVLICGNGPQPERFYRLPLRCSLEIESDVVVMRDVGDPCGLADGACQSAGGTITGQYGPPTEDFIVVERRNGCGPYMIRVACP